MGVDVSLGVIGSYYSKHSNSTHQDNFQSMSMHTILDSLHNLRLSHVVSLVKLIE